MMEKVTSLVAECETMYGLQVVYHDKISLRTLKRLRKALYRIKTKEGIVFVHGSGKKRSPLQRSIEQLEEYADRLKGYIQKPDICGERNSYSKTDHDATFMRLKEDAMLNGQLKSAYNLKHAVDSEYIVWADISAHPTNTLTLKPFLQDIERNLLYKYYKVVADAEYESEENYLFPLKKRMIFGWSNHLTEHFVRHHKESVKARTYSVNRVGGNSSSQRNFRPLTPPYKPFGIRRFNQLNK